MGEPIDDSDAPLIHLLPDTWTKWTQQHIDTLVLLVDCGTATMTMLIPTPELPTALNRAVFDGWIALIQGDGGSRCNLTPAQRQMLLDLSLTFRAFASPSIAIPLDIYQAFITLLHEAARDLDDHEPINEYLSDILEWGHTAFPDGVFNCDDIPPLHEPKEDSFEPLADITDLLAKLCIGPVTPEHVEQVAVRATSPTAPILNVLESARDSDVSSLASNAPTPVRGASAQTTVSARDVPAPTAAPNVPVPISKADLPTSPLDIRAAAPDLSAAAPNIHASAPHVSTAASDLARAALTLAPSLRRFLEESQAAPSTLHSSRETSPLPSTSVAAERTIAQVLTSPSSLTPVAGSEDTAAGSDDEDDGYDSDTRSIPSLRLKGTDKVKISLRSVYPFAYYYKGVSKTSAPTVETKEEYREFVETLKAKKLEAVNLLVDMADVEAKCAKKSSPYDDSDSEPEDAGVGSAAVSSSSTKAIEEWITKLKTAHKGFYDPKIPGVQPLALTVFMYREWATYIIDHKATLDIPPNIPVFDPKSHHRSLVPSPMPATPSPSGSGLDLSQVTNLLAVVANMVNPHTSITSPSTPSRRVSTRQSGAEMVHSSSSLVASPSDLARCLGYIAERPAYALSDVQRYEPALRQQGIAPDIITHITRDDLTRSPVKMNMGDAERFKR
ncbi:hypothetical protein LXA43DRAFT_1103697 [Ganoderma leucocontextum]|nr:hypothetical protein LXA43DRAFT_1103697 [Ganoderma leucocontextum]